MSSHLLILLPVRSIPKPALIARATKERGPVQADALAELRRRGLELSRFQREQAELEQS